jgi:hypothetical protein
MKKTLEPSEFKNLEGIEYFNFEEDFIEDNVRCIPMIVRFKMDAVGIKLKLAEWSKFVSSDRIGLAVMPINSTSALKQYKEYLIGLIRTYTKNEPTLMEMDPNPAWADFHSFPILLLEKLAEFKADISLEDWAGLSDIQRFVLLKLCRPGHENKNFPKAMVEFGLM